MRACGLCGEPLTRGGARLCSLDLCDNCFHGDPSCRLLKRGFEISFKRFRRVGRDSRIGGSTEHHLVMRGRLWRDFGVSASFVREDFTSRLGKLFSKEIQVGDPLFDDLVYVKGSTDPKLAALLREPEVQGVILEFFSVPATLKIDRTELIAEQLQPDTPPEDTALRRAMLIALHHFQGL